MLLCFIHEHDIIGSSRALPGPAIRIINSIIAGGQSPGRIRAIAALIHEVRTLGCVVLEQLGVGACRR